MPPRVSVPRIILASALLTLMVGDALAQSEATPPRSKAGNETVLLEEIPSVFGASRFDQLSTEAPASVSVLTRDDIVAHGWRTLGDVLQSVRGLYVINDGVYSSMGARAFGRPGDYNVRLLLVIDGHRMNENIYDSGMIGFESPVLVEDIERIEVIRGPASSLYGTSAFFGVINVVTTRGRAASGVRARVAVESWGTRDLLASAGQRFANGLEMRATFNRRRNEGRDYFFSEFDTSATGGWARGLDGEKRDRASVRLDWGELSVSGLLNLRSKDIATARYGVDFAVPGVVVEDHVGLLGATYNRALSVSSALRLSGSFNSADYAGVYLYSGERSSDWSRGRWGVFEAQYTASGITGHRLVIGAQRIHNFRQTQGYREEGEITFSADSVEGSFAVFVQDEYRPAPGWIVNGGLRLDRFTSFGTTLNPRLGVIRSLRSGSALKLLYGRAFRAPNVFERYYEGVDQLPNPSLAPERIQTVELLAEHQLNDRWKVTGAVFRNEVTDLIEYTDADADFIGQYQNVGEARATGLELEAEFEWRGARARASQVWQRGSDVTRRSDLSNAPRHLSTFDVTLPVTQTLTGSLELRSVSSRLAASGPRVAGYTVANLWLSARVPRLAGRIGGGVYNAFNKAYAEPTGSDFVQSYLPQTPRHFRLSVELGSL